MLVWLKQSEREEERQKVRLEREGDGKHLGLGSHGQSFGFYSKTGNHWRVLSQSYILHSHFKKITLAAV